MQFSAILFASLFATAFAAPYGAHPAEDTEVKTGGLVNALVGNGNAIANANPIGSGNSAVGGNNESAGNNSGCNGDAVAYCCNTATGASEHETEVAKTLLNGSFLNFKDIAPGALQCAPINVPVAVLGGVAQVLNKNQQCSDLGKKFCCTGGGSQNTQSGLINLNLAPNFQCNQFNL